MWSAVVREKDTNQEICRYTFDSKARAQEAVRDVKAVRVDQNHEQVTVKLEKEKDY